MRPVKLISLLIVLAASCAIEWTANNHGLWFATFIVGVAIGFVPLRASSVVFMSVFSALLGWGLPLVVMSMSYDLHMAASVIAAVMGFGTTKWFLVDIVTVVVAVLLSLSGTWLCRGVTGLFFAKPSARHRWSGNSGHRLGM